jgi:hypothetical protein
VKPKALDRLAEKVNMKEFTARNKEINIEKVFIKDDRRACDVIQCQTAEIFVFVTKIKCIMDIGSSSTHSTHLCH